MNVLRYSPTFNRLVTSPLSEEQVMKLIEKYPRLAEVYILFFDPDELDPPRRYMFCYGTERKELDFVEERHQNYVIDNEEVKDIATSWTQFIYFYADLDTSNV